MRTQPITPTRPHLETSFSTPTAALRIRDPSDDDDESSAAQSPRDTPVNAGEGSGATDLYKQKIESLKTELGPNWLTGLNDDRFSDDRSFVEYKGTDACYAPKVRVRCFRRHEAVFATGP